MLQLQWEPAELTASLCCLYSSGTVGLWLISCRKPQWLRAPLVAEQVERLLQVSLA